MLGGELRECEELLYAFFEDAPEAIFLSECEGDDCRWTVLNEAGCRMLGYAREELVGTRLTELCPVEDAEQLARHLDASAAPGRSVVTELRMRRKDGATLHLYVRVKKLPNGRSYAMLREGSAFWMHAVFEQSPIGLALMPGARFAQLEFNARAEQMLGRPSDRNGELCGRLHGLDGHPVDPERLPIVEALRGKRVVGAEFLARNVTGGLTPIGVNADPSSARTGRFWVRSRRSRTSRRTRSSNGCAPNGARWWHTIFGNHWGRSSSTRRRSPALPMKRRCGPTPTASKQRRLACPAWSAT